MLNFPSKGDTLVTTIASLISPMPAWILRPANHRRCNVKVLVLLFALLFSAIALSQIEIGKPSALATEERLGVGCACQDTPSTPASPSR